MRKNIDLESWVEGLFEAVNRVETSQGEITKEAAIAYLLGYARSAKYLL